MRSVQLLALLAALCLALPAAAAPKDSERPFQVKPPAAWVRPVPLEARDSRPLDEAGGVHYALAEIQARVEGPSVERYAHYARRVLTEGGIEDAAEINVTFDPSFERLTLHGVWLHRGGERKDVLDPSAVKVIQQERELEQRLYNGTLSALIFVRDVRVGDVIEYAFTTEGANPVFGGRYLSSADVRFGSPLGHWRYRLLWPSARTLHVKNHRTDLSPSVKEAGGVREYVWEQRDVPALDVDDALPSWYDPWPWIQFSEFESWAAVARWAVPLYQAPTTLSPALAAEVARLRAAHATPSARLLGALRFVQDEVRYLGMELGPNSHRPHAPEEVLARRFGDCKDKTLLLVTLLRALGLEARPALVHTDWQHKVETMHPSPSVFDHVIVQARLEGREYWLDPTVSHERGPLEAFEPPPFRRALPIDEATTGLVEIPEPRRLEATMEVEEAYAESASGGPVRLTVTTRWRGPGANHMRRQLSTSSLKDLEREYLNYYARNDPRIRSTAPLSVTDDPERNVLTLVERYAIESFWTDLRRDFSASSISNHFIRPRIAQRTMPLAITHPVNVLQRIRFEMLQPIRGEHEQDTIQGPAGAMDYSYWTEGAGRVLFLEYRYRSLKDAVEPSELMAHLEALKRMEAHTGYQVTLDRPRVSGGGAGGAGKLDFTWGAVALGLGGLALGGLLMMMNDGPRAFLRELRARRRKRAFSRKFDPVEGDSPAQAIVLATVTDLPARLSRVRCACGVAGAEAPKLEEVVLGEQQLVLAKWACPDCGRARHAYFSVREARAA
jgi:transglutaminase-like putative cysteine protease